MQGRQVHALRACSLVAIPPLEGRMPPPGGFPKDLATINLTGWASLIQDVAQGMKMVPSNLSMEVYLDSMMLLQLLEATTGMGYCRICCQPTPSCLCAGAYKSVPTQAWSQMMASIPAPGVVASFAGSTTSEASTVEVQEPGVTSPPLGLTPQDFSNWSLPLPGAPQTGGLPLPSGGGVDRQAEGPWAPTPQSQMPSAPWGMLPVHQQRPAPTSCPVSVTSAADEPTCGSLSATSTANEPTCGSLSATNAANEPAGSSVSAASTADKPTCGFTSAGSTTARPAQYPIPAGRAATEASWERTSSSTFKPRRRTFGWTSCPGTREATNQGKRPQGPISQSPGRGRGLTTNALASSTQGGTQPQPGHRSRTSHYDPVIIAGNYRSSGWRKDLEHVLKVYYRYSL